MNTNNILKRIRIRSIREWIFFALIGLGILVWSVTPSFAKTNQERIEELRKQIEILEEQAKQYRGSIAQNQQQARTLQNEINSLRGQISGLEVQISATGKKIDKTGIEINNVSGEIHDTEQNIHNQEETISILLRYLYQRDQDSLVGVLMKTPSLEEYFRQEQYALTIDDSLLQLVAQLKEDQERLTKQRVSLETKKEELEELKVEQGAQKVSLLTAKKSKDTILVQTKGQEAQFQKLLSNVEKQKAQFFNELRALESNVVAGGLYLVHVTASQLPKKGTKLFQWPEDHYRLTQGYGMTTYAKRGAYGGAPHNGIDIASGYGSARNALGGGKIIAAGNNTGWGNWIAIQHPPYNLVSVYGHMSSFGSIRVGSQVRMGQVIGYEGSTGNSTGSHLHISLYKEFFTYQNERKNGQLYFNYFEGSINPMDYL